MDERQRHRPRRQRCLRCGSWTDSAIPDRCPICRDWPDYNPQRPSPSDLAKLAEYIYMRDQDWVAVVISLAMAFRAAEVIR